MADEKFVTGQVLFREASRGKPVGIDIGTGRRLVSFAGIIAVPEDFEFKGEHQYVITGNSSGSILAIHPETGIDRTERVRGYTLGGTLLETIWRV